MRHLLNTLFVNSEDIYLSLVIISLSLQAKKNKV